MLEAKIHNDILKSEQRLIKQMGSLQNRLSHYIQDAGNELTKAKSMLSEQINQLGHGVHYILEQIIPTYDTKACMEMIDKLITGSRPFSGKAIQDREQAERLKHDYCIFLLGFLSCIVVAIVVMLVTSRISNND